MLKKIGLAFALGFILLVLLAYFRYVFNEPYNLLADSKAEITDSISKLGDRQLLIVILGANWCPECRLLASEIESGPLKPLDGTALSFVKVDVNGWDRNMDIVEKLDNPTSGGIPAIAIIDSQGRLLATRTGKQLSREKSIKGSYFEYFSWLSDTYINNEHYFNDDSNALIIDMK